MPSKELCSKTKRRCNSFLFFLNAFRLSHTSNHKPHERVRFKIEQNGAIITCDARLTLTRYTPTSYIIIFPYAMSHGQPCLPVA